MLPSDAWDEAKNQLHVPGPYQQRRNGLGKDLPTSLARLLARQDRREEARSILAATYAWFTEGFDTGDLREAKSLLDALRPH